MAILAAVAKVGAKAATAPKTMVSKFVSPAFNTMKKLSPPNLAEKTSLSSMSLNSGIKGLKNIGAGVKALSMGLQGPKKALGAIAGLASPAIGLAAKIAKPALHTAKPKTPGLGLS